MKIILLGGYGQLGSDILAHKSDAPDTQIQVLDRHRLDVEQHEKVMDTLSRFQFDALINCTAYHKTDEAEGFADKAIAVNALAVREMAKACQLQPAKFIHLSTDYVFGGPNNKSPLNETDAPAPVNVYGTSRLMGESLAQNHCDQTTILRVASLFGIAGASGKGGNFVETMIRLAKERGQLNVVADQEMSPTSTADVAWMIMALLQADVPPGIYHAVNSGYASWYEFAKTIIETADIPATINPIPSSEFPSIAARPAYSVLSNKKLAGYIGAIPNWRTALRHYLQKKGHIAKDSIESNA